MISRQTLGSLHPIKPLGDLVEVLDHLRKPVTAKNRKPGPFPYYGANGQQDSVAEFIFDEPLVLVAEDGGFFGSPDKKIAYRIDGKSWVNNHAHVLRSRPHVDRNYLCRHLEQYDVRSFTSGTTRPKLTKTQLLRIPISVPPLAEQKRIAEVLDLADSLIKKRRESIEQLDLLIKSTFLEMFGDPVTNPMGWDGRPLGELCDLVNGRGFKSEEWEDSGLPIIRIQNLNDDTKPFNYTSRHWPEQFRVNKGDVLLSWSGTPGTSFGCFRWRGAEGWLNQHIFRVSVSSQVDDTFFIYSVNARLAELVGNAHGGVGLKHITKGKLTGVCMTVPPLDLQHRFAAIVESIEKQKAAQKAQLKELENLFASLQHNAFNGTLWH